MCTKTKAHTEQKTNFNRGVYSLVHSVPVRQRWAQKLPAAGYFTDTGCSVWAVVYLCVWASVNLDFLQSCDCSSKKWQSVLTRWPRDCSLGIQISFCYIKIIITFLFIYLFIFSKQPYSSVDSGNPIYGYFACMIKSKSLAALAAMYVCAGHSHSLVLFKYVFVIAVVYTVIKVICIFHF